jgi:hypothetical protein
MYDFLPACGKMKPLFAQRQKAVFLLTLFLLEALKDG